MRTGGLENGAKDKTGIPSRIGCSKVTSTQNPLAIPDSHQIPGWMNTHGFLIPVPIIIFAIPDGDMLCPPPSPGPFAQQDLDCGLPTGVPKQDMSILAFASTTIYHGLPWVICPTVRKRWQKYPFRDGGEGSGYGGQPSMPTSELRTISLIPSTALSSLLQLLYRTFRFQTRLHDLHLQLFGLLPSPLVPICRCEVCHAGQGIWML